MVYLEIEYNYTICTRIKLVRATGAGFEDIEKMLKRVEVELFLGLSIVEMASRGKPSLYTASAFAFGRSCFHSLDLSFSRRPNLCWYVFENTRHSEH